MRALLNVLSARGSLAVVLLAALIGSNSRATSPAAPSPPTTEPITRHWTLDGVERVATLYVPESARTRPTPVVFAFHGHGGHAEQFAGKLKLHEAWPDAIVVYPQGLNTP